MSNKTPDIIAEEKAERAAITPTSPVTLNKDISSLAMEANKLVQQYENKLLQNDKEIRLLRSQLGDLQTDLDKAEIRQSELHKECDRLLRQNQLDRQFAMNQEGELQAKLNKLELQYNISLSVTSDLMLRLMKAKEV